MRNLFEELVCGLSFLGLTVLIKLFLDGLKSDEHDNVPAAETHKVGCETFVKGAKTFVFHDVADNSKKAGWLPRRGVHHSGF